MKKSLSLFSIIAMVCCCAMFTSCTPDEDIEEAMVLRGEWQGDWKMSYETHLGHVFYAYSTNLQFFTNSSYTNRGYGYQVDFYDYGPYRELYSRFNWEIRDGVIYINYPDDHWYDTYIYEYRLTDRHFTGYLGETDLYFDLVKLASFDWDYYYGYGDYSYWTYSDYVWDSGDYYFYTRTRGGVDVDSSAIISEPDEPERIVRIGSRLSEKKKN